MTSPSFLTISDDLIHVANDAFAHFTDSGFNLEIEPTDLGFPTTPALVCRRGHERVVVEIISGFDKTRLKRWVDYCKSQTEDSRFCVIAFRPSDVENKLIEFCSTHSVGLIVHDNEKLMPMRAPVDLAVHAALPELSDLKASVRPILAPAYQKFADGDWRDGLYAAYSEVEEMARENLIAEIDSGKSIYRTYRGKQVEVTSKEAGKMTLGQLAIAYGNISKPTHKDARIHQTLSLINETRVGLAHKRKKAEVEKKVRTEAGMHIHAVTNCLEELMP